MRRIALLVLVAMLAAGGCEWRAGDTNSDGQYSYHNNPFPPFSQLNIHYGASQTLATLGRAMNWNDASMADYVHANVWLDNAFENFVWGDALVNDGGIFAQSVLRAAIGHDCVRMDMTINATWWHGACPVEGSGGGGGGSW